MKLFDLLALMDSDVSPEQSKIHLACWNGKDDPLCIYRVGGFNEWQCWQTKRNFGRKYVVSLISMPGASRWLYAGVHSSNGYTTHTEIARYCYNLTELPSCSRFNGRIVVTFDRTGRNSYRDAETIVDRIIVAEMFPQPLTIGDFPGFKLVNLTKSELDTIVGQQSDSWKSALSNVAGVYLISDSATGKLYVGSATGEGGIWQRWCQYSSTGHGGNRELKKIIGNKGMQAVNAFRFSVLEIADTHASHEDILKREAHWKNVLLSRIHGMNAN